MFPIVPLPDALVRLLPVGAHVNIAMIGGSLFILQLVIFFLVIFLVWEQETTKVAFKIAFAFAAYALVFLLLGFYALVLMLLTILALSVAVGAKEVREFRSK